MNRAFIVSRPYDLPLARQSRARLHRQGWLAQIMLDPREWPDFPPDAIPAGYWTGGRGMYGNGCAAAIVAGIMSNSKPGDTVAKLDCDIWLSGAASQWLQQANPARCLRYGGKPWGACWAATRDGLALAAAAMARQAQCRCPESHLIIEALRGSCGIESPAAAACESWKHGQEWPDGCFAATLPVAGRNYHRLESGLAMFIDHPPP